jgi:DNA repair protein RecO (recombination protein O)
MPLVETEGLIIKTHNLSEADKIVVLMTRDHGMVRGVAKGAKRLNSKFGGGLEPFSVVQITYVQKDALELVAIQRVDLIKSNFEAASNPEFLQKFAHLAELLITFSPPHDPNDTLYRMVKACLETAASSATNLPAVGVYFQLWLLRLSGFLPDWGVCHNCGRRLLETEVVGLTDVFQTRCDNCSGPAATSLSASARSIALSVRNASPDKFAESTRENEAVIVELRPILDGMLSQAVGGRSVREIPLTTGL